MFFIIPNDTEAYARLPQPIPQLHTIDDLMALQNVVGCDMRILMPKKNSLRLVTLLDP